MNPKQFLLFGGVVLILYGVVGVIVPDQSLLGGALYFTGAENIAHLVLGVVAIAASYVLSPMLQKWLVAAVGVLALVFMAIGFAVISTPPLNVPPGNLELVDDVVHLAVTVWALWAAFRPMPAAAMQGRPMAA
jgi:hypothetical protein